jgi:hypothetical protein
MFTVMVPDAELTFDRFECAIAHFAQNYCRCDTQVLGYGQLSETRLHHCPECEQEKRTMVLGVEGA